jgi:hypothetical protein
MASGSEDLLREGDLGDKQHTIKRGAQTERRGDVGLVRDSPGGKTSPAASLFSVLTPVAAFDAPALPGTVGEPPRWSGHSC